MAMNVDDLARGAAEQTAKNHASLNEGEYIMAMVPFHQGVAFEGGRFKRGIPYVGQQMLGGTYGTFKRPVMSVDQKYFQTPEAQAALRAAGKDGVSSLADAMVESGKAEKATLSRSNVCAWVVCIIADRARAKQAWSSCFEKPQIARFKRGKEALPHPQRIIETEVFKPGLAGEMFGELDAWLDKRRAAEGDEEAIEQLLEAEVRVRLLHLVRKGSGQYETTWSGGLLEEKDDPGNDYAGGYLIEGWMLESIYASTLDGGYANIHTYSAESSLPGQDEIDSKVYGLKAGETRSESGESDVAGSDGRAPLDEE